MSGWEKVKLEELYEVHNGLSKPRSAFGSGHPFLSFSTVFNNFFLPESLDSLVQSSEAERESFSIRRGDVFVTRTSETPEELGMSSVALKDYPDATYNGFCKRLRPVSERVWPEFIGYVFRHFAFRSKFYGLAGSMTSRASLKNEDLLDMEISLPPLAEQRRIAGVLRAYDEAIENCRRQISLLEEATQMLYRNRFLSGNEDNWESVSILDNDVFRFVSPKVTPFRGEKFYYATADVDGTGIVGQGEFVSFDNRPSRASIQPIPNSVWFARMSNSYKILCFIEGCGGLENRCIISSGFAGFSSAPEHFGYVYCTIASRLFDEMKNRFATGATQVSLTNEGLGKISVRLPPREAIRDFSSIVLPYLMNAELLRCQIKSFSEARDRLLPRLLNGEASA